MYALNLLEMTRGAGQHPVGLCGPGDEVLRALRVHRVRRVRAGPVGRGGRLLLRRHPAAGRDQRAAEGAVGGRPAPAGRDDDPVVGDPDPAAASSPNGCAGSWPTGPSTARRSGPAGSATASSNACSPRSGRTSCCASSCACSTRTSSFRRTGCARLSRAHLEQPYTVTLAGDGLHRRLRAGRVDHGLLRRQLQLARAGLVPGEPPHHRGTAAVRGLLRRRPSGGVPYRLGREAHARRDRRRPVPPPGAACSCSTRRAAGPLHGDYELFQTDERWRDLIPFYEYFHGDTGAGLGASHQTGWTALVVDLIITLPR